MKRIIILFLLNLILTNPVLAAEQAKNAGAFLENGTGARPLALDSFVALADDSNAIYWNPAGLAQNNNIEVNTMGYQAWETDYLNIQGCMPLGAVNIGFAYLNAQVENILETQANPDIDQRYIQIGTFGYGANAFLGSIAYNLLPDFAIGTTIKYIQEELYTNKASGISSDLGFLYYPIPEFKIGLNIQNIAGSAITWDTTSNYQEYLPMNVKAGVALNTWDNKLNLLTDINYRQDRDLKVNIGSEYWINKHLALRIGLDPVAGASAPTQLFKSVGIGLYLGQIKFNAAWTNQDQNLDIDQIEDIYRFSIGYTLEQNKPKQKIQSEIIDSNLILPPPAPVTPDIEEDIEPIQEVVEEPEIIEPVMPVSEGFTVEVKTIGLARGQATIEYSIFGGRPGENYVVNLYIKDSYGELVKQLIINEEKQKGTYYSTWYMTNENQNYLLEDRYDIKLFVHNREDVQSDACKVDLLLP